MTNDIGITTFLVIAAHVCIGDNFVGDMEGEINLLCS